MEIKFNWFRTGSREEQMDYLHLGFTPLIPITPQICTIAAFLYSRKMLDDITILSAPFWLEQTFDIYFFNIKLD